MLLQEVILNSDLYNFSTNQKLELLKANFATYCLQQGEKKRSSTTIDKKKKKTSMNCCKKKTLFFFYKMFTFSPSDKNLNWIRLV